MRKLLKNYSEKISEHRVIDVVFIGAAVVIGWVLNWSILSIATCAVAVAAIVWPIPSRYLGWGAFLFFVFTALFLTTDRATYAEASAISAFYFFAMAVIRLMVETRQGKHDEIREA